MRGHSAGALQLEPGKGAARTGKAGQPATHLLMPRVGPTAAAAPAAGGSAAQTRGLGQPGQAARRLQRAPFPTIDTTIWAVDAPMHAKGLSAALLGFWGADPPHSLALTIEPPALPTSLNQPP